MKIHIIGAGIAGLTTAIAFKKAGITTTVYEAAPEIKPVGAGLALAANAIKAFQKLGIAESIMAAGRLLPHFSILDKQGKPLTTVDSMALRSKYGIDNFLIHRSKLHSVLLSHLDENTVQTNKRAVSIKGNLVHFADGSTTTPDVLIIADGINSTLRKQLLPQVQTNYSGYTCWRAIVHAPDLTLEGATETWDPAGRFGIAPLSHGDIYWFACINAPANDAGCKRFTTDDLYKHFVNFHQPIGALIKRTDSGQLLHNDIYDLSPLSHYAYDNILLIGDAAHATTPNMGQGACQAIEDAIILVDEWQKHSNYRDAFKAFEKRRIKRTHYIIRQSRKIGQIAHVSNHFIAGLRNVVMRNMPRSLREKQYAKVYDVDF